jgi:glycine hydroxymethyltransferase
MNFEALRKVDPVLAELLESERRRQEETLDLIASENFCPRSVREAVGSSLTDKYAEGYPLHRWYGGCNVVDAVEQLAIDRGKRLFGGEHINVQPHSGSQANMAVYFSILRSGDTILSMDLAHGGHLTHGKKANFSGRLYTIVHYGVSPKTEQIDYDALARQAREVRPALIVGGASAYPRAFDCARMAEIARDAGARLMIDMAHFAGLVVGKQHPDPVPVADFVTATTHKTLRGPRGALILCKEQYREAIDKTTFPGMQGGPLEHCIAAKAVALKEAMTPEFKTYQQQVVKNAAAMADELAKLGFRLVAGGTDTHLMLVDLRAKNITGRDAERALHVASITVNRNTIPYDPQKPFVASGVRLGTPALTTRGMKEDQMRKIAQLIDQALVNVGNAEVYARIRGEVKELTDAFPLYAERRAEYAAL